MPHLVPGDESIFLIVPDEDDDGGLHAHRGFDFLRIHHEAGVAGDSHHLALRRGQLGGDRARHRDAHRRETVGDDAGVRPLGAVHARHPHLVRAHVGDHDVVGRQYFTQVPDDFLRFDRETRVRCIFDPVGHDRAAYCRERRGLLRRGAHGNPVQRGIDVAEYADGDDIVFIDFGRQPVDVDDDLVGARVPHVGVVLDHVVADADDNVGLLECEPRQVARLQPDGAQRQVVGKGHDAFRHE